MQPNERRARGARSKQQSTGRGELRWSAVFAVAGGALALGFGLFFGLRILLDEAKPSTLVISETGLPSIAPSSLVVEESTKPDESFPLGSFENPIDLSEGARKIVSKESTINMPDISGQELVYSAGSGSLSEPLLETLYLYDFEQDEEREMAKVRLKDGEIFETVVNNDYIAWVDTDQQGSNAIYCLYRERIGQEEEDAIKMVRQCSFATPKLRLSNDFLIWIEQIEKDEERLFVVDLISEENASMPGFVESIEKAMNTYGVSAPSISGSQIVWAGSDPNLSDEDRILKGEQSAIFYCDMSRFVEDGYSPEFFSTGMYVHDPITNGDAWAWIDKNKAPDSNLYLKYGEEIRQVAQGVMLYALGDEMLVFYKNGAIYAYFYLTDQYGRLTPEGVRGITPVVSGRRVVWFNKSADSGKDQLMTLTVPYTFETTAQQEGDAAP
ncbi:MAG: hypothetical protein LBD02_10520 [Christensenellaceae bacterium]|jgi:hypothetical protein|nr:hypothetical protein [Christensenellaceae bacterium]